jgi:predicted glycoside hydrolase/deacetylase ChbG (UPF0249 family)
MQRRIVFCADDLGISPGTNTGIRAAARQGLVKEASICMTGSAVEEGIRIAKEASSSLSVGLHLSFTLGMSLTGPLQGLTDEEGRFLSLPKVLLACLFRKIEPKQIEREVEAQLALLADQGIQPSHLNGHHHVHCFPGIRQAVLTTLSRWNLRWTRLPREHGSPLRRLSPRHILLSRFAKAFHAQTAGLPLRHLTFLGLSTQDQADYRRIFLETLDTLPAGDYEWMVHPRAPDDSFAQIDNLRGKRGSQAPVELATLCDPSFVAALRSRGVEPVTFANLD